jgi:hypothetical protein
MDATKIPIRPNGATPRWAKENYTGMEQDLGDYLYAVAFYELYGDKIDLLDSEYAKARALAEARLAALARSHDLGDAVERSIVWQMFEFQKYGWGMIIGEYPTLREVMALLADRIPEGDSRKGQAMFLVEQLLPAMENSGVPIQDVVGIPENFNKALEVVPRLRRAIEAEDVDEIKEIIGKVVDKRETKDTVREWLRGQKKIPLEKIKLETYVRPNGEELTVLRLPTPAHKRAVQMGLRSMLDGEEIHASMALVKELTEEIMSSREGRGLS